MIFCKNCGNPCRIGTEPVGRDQNGLPVFHRFSYCDRCRLKEDLDINTEEKAEVYSIISFVFAIVSLVIVKLMPVISVIIGLISFVLAALGMEEKYRVLAQIAIVLFLITMLIFMFGTTGWLCLLSA